MSKLTFGKMSATTPLWAKKIRNTALKIGGALVGVGTALLTLPLSLPATVTVIATNAILYGGSIGIVVSALSQAFGIKEEEDAEEVK